MRYLEQNPRINKTISNIINDTDIVSRSFRLDLELGSSRVGSLGGIDLIGWVGWGRVGLRCKGLGNFFCLYDYCRHR